jgi:chromate reductase
MFILGVSGSLRSGSTNTRLLEAATRLLPVGVNMRLTALVGQLPLFNPDQTPEDGGVVEQWVVEMRDADAVVISTPDYARGYPGSLKNALDWLVATDAFVRKPFMMLGASARSTIGRDTLITVLETMSGVHIADASATVNLLGAQLEPAQIAGHSEHAALIRRSMSVLVAQTASRREA